MEDYTCGGGGSPPPPPPLSFSHSLSSAIQGTLGDQIKMTKALWYFNIPKFNLFVSKMYSTSLIRKGIPCQWEFVFWGHIEGGIGALDLIAPGWCGKTQCVVKLIKFHHMVKSFWTIWGRKAWLILSHRGLFRPMPQVWQWQSLLITWLVTAVVLAPWFLVLQFSLTACLTEQ